MTQAEGRNREPSNTGCSTRRFPLVSLSYLPVWHTKEQGNAGHQPELKMQALLAVQREAGIQVPLATQTARKEPGRRRVSATENVRPRVSLNDLLFFRCEPYDVHQATQACPEQDGASPCRSLVRFRGTLPNSLRSTIRIIDGKYAQCQHPRR